ncbi:hypothetical protein GJ744_001174 [Endocarpon pusillum]|uniref:Uncharacterized protein n=1 Tax=Endocarpon pusillum TaxID=364733 RepID=A0A8H7ABY5_9EURO|nr:hypothetical protein GJ744_001174 [Endocarpon pusillum]
MPSLSTVKIASPFSNSTLASQRGGSEGSDGQDVGEIGRIPVGPSSILSTESPVPSAASTIDSQSISSSISAPISTASPAPNTSISQTLPFPTSDPVTISSQISSDGQVIGATPTSDPAPGSGESSSLPTDDVSAQASDDPQEPAQTSLPPGVDSEPVASSVAQAEAAGIPEAATTPQAVSDVLSSASGVPSASESIPLLPTSTSSLGIAPSFSQASSPVSSILNPPSSLQAAPSATATPSSSDLAALTSIPQAVASPSISAAGVVALESSSQTSSPAITNTSILLSSGPSTPPSAATQLPVEGQPSADAQAPADVRQTGGQPSATSFPPGNSINNGNAAVSGSTTASAVVAVGTATSTLANSDNIAAITSSATPDAEIVTTDAANLEPAITDAANADAANADAANGSSSLLQLAPSLTTTPSSVNAIVTDALGVDNQAVGGQASAVAFPPIVPDNGNNRNENFASSSISSTAVAANTGDALNAVLTSSQNANAAPPTGTATSVIASSPLVEAPPPSIGSSFPAANGSPPAGLGTSFPPAISENAASRTNGAITSKAFFTATNAGRPPEQTSGASDQLGAQATQTSATAIFTNSVEQQPPNTPSQAPVPPNSQSTDASSTDRVIGSAFGPPATSSAAPTDASSTARVIGNAFSPPATSSTAPTATQDNNLNQSGNSNNIIAASSTSSAIIDNEPSAKSEIAGSGANNQANAAETVSALSAQITQDPLADISNSFPSNALDSAPDASDPSRPSISGLGKEFMGTTDAASLQSTDTIIDGPGTISSASAGIGTATSLITSALASRRPTGTITGGPSPTAPITKETAGGLAAIRNAFLDPVTRPKAIGSLVAVVIGFLLVVAVIVYLWWFLRRKKQQQGNASDTPSSGDGEKGGLNISGPISRTTQEDIANYDPSAELMGNSAGLDYGPSQPSQLDNALMDRVSRLSNSRKSFLDIYGATTPYPQDVVDGSGRPLTQQLLMPEADKFQLKGLGPMSPFAPKVPGLGSAAAHQRNISTASKLSNLPADMNPDLPAPTADLENPFSPTDPALSSGHFQPTTDTIDEDPFSDEMVSPLAPLGAAKMGTMKSQNPRRRMAPKRSDSWMTVNTVATSKPAPPPTAGGIGHNGKPSRTDYASVYMRNPFDDPPEASSGAAVPAMPAIPKHLQSKNPNRNELTESVTLMFSPTTANAQYNHPQPQPASTRPLSGPGDTEVMYNGVLDDYPPRPPSTHVGVASVRGKAYGVARKSNPFDLEVEDDGRVKSVRSWLTGVEQAERNRMENENVI